MAINIRIAMMMITWRRDCAAQIPGSWIQVDLGTFLAYLSFPQSEHYNDHYHGHGNDDDDDDADDNARHCDGIDDDIVPIL